MPTMEDVARLAGVSTATVSRAMNAAPGVTPEKRARVLEAIASLRYQPNTSAKSLRTRRSGRLLVWVPSLTSALLLPLLSGIELATARTGAALMLGRTPPDAIFGDRLHALLSAGEIDAFILVALSGSAARQQRRWLSQRRMGMSGPGAVIAPAEMSDDRALQDLGERSAWALLEGVHNGACAAHESPRRGAREHQSWIVAGLEHDASGPLGRRPAGPRW